MRKIKLWVAALLVAVMTLSCMTGCELVNGLLNPDSTDEDKGAGKTYTFEAEGVDFSGMTSFGFSVNISETQMIMGSHVNVPENVVKSASNGYFVGYFNPQGENGLTLRFVINADKASEGNTLTLRLATEYGTMTVTPNEMDVIVNGTALQYNPITVVGENLTSVNEWHGYAVPFNDYKLSSTFALKEGENVIELKIKTNELGFADDVMLKAVGPGVDCIKIRSESTLTWESLWEDNKEEIGVE